MPDGLILHKFLQWSKASLNLGLLSAMILPSPDLPKLMNGFLASAIRFSVAS